MREPTWENRGVGAVQVGIAVPGVVGIGPLAPKRVNNVLLAVGAGKEDDGDPWSAQSCSSSKE